MKAKVIQTGFRLHSLVLFSIIPSRQKRGGHCRAICAQDTLHENEHNTKVYTARSSHGSSRTAPYVTHRGGGDKYATGATSTSTKKLRGRDYIGIATWNVGTAAKAGRLQEITHALER